MGFYKRFNGAGGSNRRGEILSIREQTFLDRRPVVDALDKKYRTVMARLGGYARTTMQRSMRRRAKKAPSKEGQPPNAHKGTLRALIEFGYDLEKKTLVAGPHKIDSPTKPFSGKTVPQLLNEGGYAMVYKFGGGSVMKHFGPRPFVEPALKKTITKLADLVRTIPLKFKGR